MALKDKKESKSKRKAEEVEETKEEVKEQKQDKSASKPEKKVKKVIEKTKEKEPTKKEVEAEKATKKVDEVKEKGEKEKSKKDTKKKEKEVVKEESPEKEEEEEEGSDEEMEEKEEPQLSLRERIAGHSKFVNQLVSLVSPKVYFNNTPLSSGYNKYMKNTKEIAPKQAIKEAVQKGAGRKEAKLRRFDPNNMKTVLEIQQSKVQKKGSKEEFKKNIQQKLNSKQISLSDLKKSSNVKNEEKPTEVEASIQYSKIETGVEQPSKKRKLEPKAALNKVLQKRAKIEKLQQIDSQKASKMLNVQEWKSAMAKAEGKKVQDDPNLLKKTIKRKEKQKKKSTEEWTKRKESVENAKEAKQKKRKENLKERKESKGKKGKKVNKAKYDKKPKPPGFKTKKEKKKLAKKQAKSPGGPNKAKKGSRN